MSNDNDTRGRSLRSSDSGPYVLRKVLDNLPLDTEGSSEPVSITCVEFWNENLYVGTSASEILHLVRLPPETAAENAQYILASRLQPSGHDAELPTQRIGVQQILVLPGALKACVLCNGTASFYTLPELSPAFPTREPTGVQWIGGYDENQGRNHPEGTAIMIATSRRMLQVRVGDRLRPIRPNVEYPECLIASRRDTIACVANAQSYALLEIEHQQKIHLSEISSTPYTEPVPATQPGHNTGHGRSKSLGDFSATAIERTASPARDALSPPVVGERSRAPDQYAQRESAGSRPTSRPRASSAETSPSSTQRSPENSLKPHILSPTPNEFMLTTGTVPSEPGVGVFVNLEGDVSRGTIEFDRYPQAVLATVFPQADNSITQTEQDQIIVALLSVSTANNRSIGLQIQALTSDGSSQPSKSWLQINDEDPALLHSSIGLHQCLSVQNHSFPEVANLLRAIRYRATNSKPEKHESDPRTKSTIERLEQETALFENQSNGSTSPTPDYDAKRSAEELVFVQRLGHAATQVMTWHNSQLWLLLNNPLLLQLEGQLSSTIPTLDNTYNFGSINTTQVMSFLGSVREQEPKNETEFLSIVYARQKASIVLFLHLLSNLEQNLNMKAACRLVESALIEGELDPRLPLSLLRPLSREVVHGKTGIWIQQGINECLHDFASPVTSFKEAPLDFWMMIRHYLSSWQDKRGASGSLSDEKAIFDSVDAALLHLLLHLDTISTSADGTQAPMRAKLHNVVDYWKGDFDRAVTLLEHYKLLFTLSRLYQSRKLSKDVLNTWKRICDGEDNNDKNIDAEAIYVQMRKYLPQLRDGQLVKEYAVWLAQRSPNLAVQVLSDDNSKVKFPPAEVVTMLKSDAPGSVQLFLEHLVFTKNLDQYADDLVGYYLDSVLSVLEVSQTARQSLADSYTTYRALISPKPTYLNFIQENAPDEPWWQSRLRLLQLLGTGGYASASGSSKTLTYSIEKVLDRLAPFSTYLVSESIILDARQGRHHEALKLLVHGLGDYDTAVRYCYFGGPSTPVGTIDVSLLPTRKQQQDQFRFLFTEFIKIEDTEERLDRTSHLLGTFAPWFDSLEVLNDIPEDWSLSSLSDFLVRTFRAATTERNQAIIIKALSAAQNLQKQADFINTCEKIGAQLEADPHMSSNQPDGDIVVS